jgi:DUF1365 family protein
MTLESAIYEGTVRHRRFAEFGNEFTHPIALAYVDLGELPRLPIAKRGRLVRFERSDYLGDPSKPLDQDVRDLVEDRIGTRPRGPVRLLTQLRSFGHCFNPVSFYYCFDDAGKLQAVVADVTNTPWGERHQYVIERSRKPGAVLKGDSEKALHVSPFMGMEQRYGWRVSEPGDTLSVHIESRNDTARAFDATLSLRRKELTRQSLSRLPGTSLRTVALIYGHALGLKLKGVRVHPHPQEAM